MVNDDDAFKASTMIISVKPRNGGQEVMDGSRRMIWARSVSAADPPRMILGVNYRKFAFFKGFSHPQTVSFLNYAASMKTSKIDHLVMEVTAADWQDHQRLRTSMNAFIRLTQIPEVDIQRVGLWFKPFDTAKFNSFVSFGRTQDVFQGPFRTCPDILATLKETDWPWEVLPGEKPASWYCVEYDAVRSNLLTGGMKEEEWVVDSVSLARRWKEGWERSLREDFLPIAQLFSHTLKKLRFVLHLPAGSWQDREMINLICVLLLSRIRPTDCLPAFILVRAT